MALVTKRPSEVIPRSLDYADRLPSGVTVDSVALSAVRLADGSDATGTVLVGATATVTGGTVASYGIQAGALEEDYEVTLIATLSTAHTIEDVVVFGVRDIRTET